MVSLMFLGWMYDNMCDVAFLGKSDHLVVSMLPDLALPDLLLPDLLLPDLLLPNLLLPDQIVMLYKSITAAKS
jgi:hypothetical protein